MDCFNLNTRTSRSLNNIGKRLSPLIKLLSVSILLISLGVSVFAQSAARPDRLVEKMGFCSPADARKNYSLKLAAWDYLVSRAPDVIQDK